MDLTLCHKSSNVWNISNWKFKNEKNLWWRQVVMIEGREVEDI